jgi:hypothetical protein
VLRKWTYLAALAAILAPWKTACAQDPATDQPQSLGEVARQARRDKAAKNAAPAKTVITEDNVSAGGDLGGLGLGDLSAPPSAGNANPLDAGRAGLSRAELALNKLEPMDRVSLARAVLGNNNVDFPNRHNWEERLFAAKQLYIARSRVLIKAMRQLLAQAESMQAQSQDGNNKVSPNDPRVQALFQKSQQIVQAATQTEAEFQAVINEGQDLAKDTAPH